MWRTDHLSCTKDGYITKCHFCIYFFPVTFFKQFFVVISFALITTIISQIFELQNHAQFCKGLQVSPFKGTQPLTQLVPLFKIVSTSLFSVTPTFKVFYRVPPTLTQPPAALIRPTNLPWFKQISKGWFYQFNCRFLSKMNFKSFKSIYK